MTMERTGSRVGDDLVEAFAEMAAYLRGEIEVVEYELTETAPSREIDRKSEAGKQTRAD